MRGGRGGVGGAAGTGGSAGGGRCRAAPAVRADGRCRCVAGSAGGAGRGGARHGGAGGTAGTGGTAGRGGAGGTAGTGGAAGRGGTGGTAGTGGAAGRGGSGGVAGRGGAGGSAGTGGTASPCSTAAVNASAQPGGNTLPTQGMTSCGYPVLPGGGSAQYIWTTNPVGWALINPAFSPNGAACGRCVELTRTLGAQTSRVVVTVVGSCYDPACVATNTLPHFQVSPAAYQILSPFGENLIPGPTGDILTCSYVECPVPTDRKASPSASAPTSRSPAAP